MKNNKIIISIIVLLFLSITFLYYRAQTIEQPDWWVIYFSSAKNSSADFVIENQGEAKSFHWQVLEESTLVLEGDAELKEDEVKGFGLDNIKAEDKKITVKVYNDDGEERMIYKNF